MFYTSNLQGKIRLQYSLNFLLLCLKKKKTSDCAEVYDENLLSHAFSRFYIYVFLNIKIYLCNCPKQIISENVVQSQSHVQFFCDPMDCTLPGSPVHWISPRQIYWSRLPFPSPGDLLDPGVEPKSPALAGRFFTTELPGNPHS